MIHREVVSNFLKSKNGGRYWDWTNDPCRVKAVLCRWAKRPHNPYGAGFSHYRQGFRSPPGHALFHGSCSKSRVLEPNPRIEKSGCQNQFAVFNKWPWPWSQLLDRFGQIYRVSQSCRVSQSRSRLLDRKPCQEISLTGYSCPWYQGQSGFF